MNKNLAAFLRVIRLGESDPHDDARAYRMMVYGGLFSDFSDHPRRHFDRKSHLYVEKWREAPAYSTTSAAGAYQITETTWDDFIAHCGRHDFSPASQDACAVWLISRRGAIDAVNAGDLGLALRLLRDEWESFKTLPQVNAQSVFSKYALTSTPDTQPAAPIEDRSTTQEATVDTQRSNTLGTVLDVVSAVAPAAGPAGMAIGLLTSLIKGFAPLAQQKITQELTRHTDAGTASTVAQSVVDAAVQLTGKTDPVDAVVTAKADPVIMQKLETQTIASFEQAQPFLDKIAQYEQAGWKAEEDSRDAAAARAQTGGFDVRPTLARYGLMGAAFMLATQLFAVLAFVIKDAPVPELLLGLIVTTATWIMAKVGTMFDYGFGTSRSSAAKDETINIMARK